MNNFVESRVLVFRELSGNLILISTFLIEYILSNIFNWIYLIWIYFSSILSYENWQNATLKPKKKGFQSHQLQTSNSKLLYWTPLELVKFVIEFVNESIMKALFRVGKLVEISMKISNKILLQNNVFVFHLK